MDNISIRTATVDDAEALLNIYAYYVENTVISFEYDVPTIEEFSGRIAKTLKKFPYLVVEKDGEIMGYAYAGPFVGRPAYGWFFPGGMIVFFVIFILVAPVVFPVVAVLLGVVAVKKYASCIFEVAAFCSSDGKVS